LFSDGLTSQRRLAADSPESTCHQPVTTGPPACCASAPPASSQPTLSNLRAVLVAAQGDTDTFQIAVDYDAPNMYCTNTGDWPPGYTCTNDPLVDGDHLVLYLGSATSPIDVLSRAFIYFENATWTTNVPLGCGESKQVAAQITYLTTAGPLFPAEAHTDPITVVAPPCTDKRGCLACAGHPINTGSGDVSVAVPMFTLAQSPLALSFGLTYHSESPRYPALASAPVGLGWTHTYSQTLRPTDAVGSSLYQRTGEGFDSEYVAQADGSWLAASPGELRGRVVLVGGQYQLTDLDGKTTAFDAATGVWLSTTDRWGNTLQGAYDGSGSLVSVTDAEGRQIQLAYGGGQLAQVTLPGGETWRLGYQGPVLTQVFDPLHTGSQPWRTFAYAADSLGVVRLLTEARDEAGFLLEGHAYDALDRGVTSVSEGGRDLVTLAYATPAGGQTTVTHSIDGVTSQVSVFTLVYGRGRYLPLEILGDCPTCGGASSDDQHFTYFPDNHVASRTDGNGHLTQYLYNGDGNVTSRTEAVGTAQQRTTTYEYAYAPWPNFRTEIDEPSAAKAGAQKVTTFTWNASGAPETSLVTAESGYLLPGDAAPTVYTTTRTFAARHRLLSISGPRTDVVQVTTQAYFSDTDASPDRRGRLQSVTDPSGNVSTFDNYDDFGTALTATDPNGVVTALQTDSRGRVVASTLQAVPGVAGESAAYTTTFTFDGRDRLVQTLLPHGNGMAYGYEDGTNRLLDTIRLDAGGNQLERHHLTLNVIGDKVMAEDQGCGAPAPACGSWTTQRSESFVYDLYNRLAGVVHPVPAGSRTFNTYDLDGQLSTVQDEDHSSPNTTYACDALLRMTAVQQTLATAPGGVATTSYGYDVMDDLAAVTDPNGNTTTYQYDDFHRLERQVSPVTGTTTYQYDPAGNLVSTTDARGATTTRSYDASNRVLTSASQLAGVATETVTYSYDSAAAGNFGKGRLAQMTDPSGATSYAYERRGLLKSENRTIQGSAYATAYQFDANGNRSGMTYPSGRQVAYGFDFADRPFSAAAGGTTYVASASYLPFGPEAQLVFGNGTTQTRSYDLRYRPVENRLAGSSSPIADYVYSEDAVGNITAIHDGLDATFNRDFGYDDLYRLTGAATGAALWGPGSYAYDPMGNMTSLALGSSRTATFSYSGTLPKLSAVVQNGVSQSISYDPAGNEVAVGGGAFTYSARSLLTAGDGLAYTYDGRGVRVALQVVAAFGTITGIVVDQNGQPLAGATVQITGTANATATDAGGNFSLTAAAGLYTLTASKFGYLPATTTPFTLAAGGSFAAGTIQLLPAPGKITGTVVSSLDGSPLAGAAVSLAENGDTAFADAAGNFTLTEPAGSYTPTIAAAGYASQTLSSLSLAAGTTSPLGVITLIANPATLSGHVTSSAGGAPVAGASVTATSLGAAAPHVAPAGSRPGQAAAVRMAHGAAPEATFTAATDASGNFSFQLPPATYTVAIAASGFGSRTTSAVNLGPGAAFGFGTLTLDPLGTITGSVIQGNGGAPIQRATVAIVGTLNQTTTDANGRFSLIQSAGTYQLTVSAAGFVTASAGPLVLAAGATLSAGTIELSQQALAVYVGYADSLRPSGTFPVPWQGSPNTVFLGSSGPFFDAGAVRLDNATDQPLAVDSVTVDLQRPNTSGFLPPPVFSLWGSFTVPAHGTVILTQEAFPDFDTSDYPIIGCGLAVSPFDPRVPKVTLTMGGVPTAYFDTAHVLDTGGADSFYCIAGGNESLPWRLIGTTGVQASGAFQLLPATNAAQTGTAATLTAVLTEASGQPLPNVTVDFSVTAGPNHGTSGQAVTDATGRAPFGYTGTIVGTDTVAASFTNATGTTLTSNLATVTWQSPFDLSVFVGYADGSSTYPSFPVPWQGDANVLFIGGAPPFDAGAVRLDNPSATPLAVDGVVVDLQRKVIRVVDPRQPVPPIFNYWGSFEVPAHGSAILTQTAFINFDTSDYPIFDCFQNLPDDPEIPKITVTIGGRSVSFLDTAHIIDTFGYDRGLCLGINESLQWRAIGGSASTSPGQLALLPAAAANPLGALYTATAAATDAGGSALVGVTVLFTVASGPNAGLTAQAVTDANGLATFSYTGTTAGTDMLSASITNASGAIIQSSSVTALWLPTVQLALTPPSATQAVGTPYNATLLATDASNQPVPGLIVTFEITSGPNAGKTAQQTTGANGQTLYSYTSSTVGTDTLVAAVGGQGGSSLAANSVTVTWSSASSQAFTLAPLTMSQPVGTAATFTATLLAAGGQPVAAAAVTFSIASGPDAGTTAHATTGTNGQALFTFTGTAPGSDLVQATAGIMLSNPATAVWTAVPTVVTYTGPTFADFSDPVTLSARLTAATTGAALAGQALSFTLGSQTVTGVTDGTGTASVTLSPSATPGTVPLSIAFAGSVGYSGSAAAVLLAVHRDETALVYTGPAAVANGQPQTVTALLTDPQGGASLAGKTVTFTFGSVSVSATTDATGTATASLTLPASVPTGPARLQVAFAGDADELPAAATAPVVVYQPASFVIWGGNTPGLALGQYVNFWGSQWASQVTGGDYQANPSFKGYAIPAATPIAICEPTARTSGTPRLDASCWTSKPGNSSPPATLQAYIGVIVSTGIAKQGSTLYGNVAATVVLQVDPTSPYGSDPGHPGYGTIAAVIQDGAGLFPNPPPKPAPVQPAANSPAGKDTATAATAAPAATQQPAPATIATGNRRFSFYSPELHLIAESELTTSASPAVLTDYIWFGDHPVAQSDTAETTSWTFTDHLGTPILQTSAVQGIAWRAEYEPYGGVFALRSPDQHQPLRLPGQEAEQLGGGGVNGASGRMYNLMRWYRASFGRYTQADPLETGANNSFLYAAGSPIVYLDPLGLWETDISLPVTLLSYVQFSLEHCQGAGPACTKLSAVYIYCECHCLDNGLYSPQVVHLVVRGQKYLLQPQDWPYMRRKPVDTSVQDPSSAVHHELAWHIDPAIDAVRPFLDDLDDMQFVSKQDCDRHCQRVSVWVKRRFLGALKATQAAENALVTQ
jgi:RHS repeat-associated protein